MASFRSMPKSVVPSVKKTVWRLMRKTNQSGKSFFPSLASVVPRMTWSTRFSSLDNLVLSGRTPSCVWCSTCAGKSCLKHYSASTSSYLFQKQSPRSRSPSSSTWGPGRGRVREKAGNQEARLQRPDPDCQLHLAGRDRLGHKLIHIETYSSVQVANWPLLQCHLLPIFSNNTKIELQQTRTTL